MTENGVVLMDQKDDQDIESDDDALNLLEALKSVWKPSLSMQIFDLIKLEPKRNVSKQFYTMRISLDLHSYEVKYGRN
jgi:hypothetical protein